MQQNVPLLDLRPQYQALKGEIQAALNELFEKQQFILGPPVAQLEDAIATYCGTRYAVGVNSGSDALLLSLMCCGIGPGDLVITTPYTFFATAGSISRVGARPVFVDIEPATCTIDPLQLHALLDGMPEVERTRCKALIPVHLYGQCADMDAIGDIARSYGLVVIEDAAQALGASRDCRGTSRKACAMSDFGCISFFPSKNLGGFGDGGMITTENPARAEMLASLRMHGQVRDQYHHRHIGMNGRLDALQAAVLLVKLPHLDGWAEKRRENAARYDRLFAEHNLLDVITPPAVAPGCTHVFNQYVVRARNRDALREHLADHGIGCAVYYPVPLHLQECFADLGYREGDFPESERAARETLALPIFPDLTASQIERVVEEIARLYRG